MPVFIAKFTSKETKKDYYLEWSTVVDAPVTFGMSIDDFKSYYRRRYGEDAIAKLPERLERVEAKGTSSMTETLAELIKLNRAGEAENELDYDDIVEDYCDYPRKQHEA